MQPDEPGALALLEDLDEPGPALPIGDARTQAMIAAAFVPPAAIRAPRRRLRWAVAATLCAAIAGTAAAALWRASHQLVPEELPAPTAPAQEPAAPPPPPAPALAPAPVVVPRRAGSAHDLLRLANERRAEQKWREAAALYRRVEREYAGGATAYVAMMADASLRLEHLHDARGALSLYKNALTGGPASLREEAAFGVAESHRALHNPRAEADALESFAREHPDSPMAPRARERLRELGH